MTVNIFKPSLNRMDSEILNEYPATWNVPLECASLSLEVHKNHTLVDRQGRVC